MRFEELCGKLGAEVVSELASDFPSVEHYLQGGYQFASLPGASGHAPAPPLPASSHARQAVESFVAQHVAPLPVSGQQLYALLRDRLRMLPTGCDSIDLLLHGGLREGLMMEVAGESASGKTQLCHAMAARTALRGEAVAYLDTTNSFSAARVLDMMRHQDPAAGGPQLLQHIRVYQPHSMYELLEVLDGILAAAAQQQQQEQEQQGQATGTLAAPAQQEQEQQQHGGQQQQGQATDTLAVPAQQEQEQQQHGGQQQQGQATDTLAAPGHSLPTSSNTVAQHTAMHYRPHQQQQHQHRQQQEGVAAVIPGDTTLAPPPSHPHQVPQNTQSAAGICGPPGSSSLAPAPPADPAPRLLVVDSISALVSPVLGGQQHSQGHTLMMITARMLKQLAQRHHTAVLVTNHMVSGGGLDRDRGGQGPGAGAGGQAPGGGGGQRPLQPALGESWKNQAHLRLQLANQGERLRSATVIGSSSGVCGLQAWFTIQHEGLIASKAPAQAPHDLADQY